MRADQSGKQNSAETIRWENFAKFVHQFSHDLRNQLNAAELQSALVGELNKEGDLKPELMRLRELVAQVGASLQRLSSAVTPPNPIRLPYAAQDLIADLQKKMARNFPEQSQRVRWDVDLNGTMLNIDPELIGWAAAELFENAFRNDSGEIAVSACRQNGRFLFVVRESKREAVDPGKWGELFRVVNHGHYGLGLRRARAIISAHDGELISEFDPSSSTLTSRMILPCSTESS